MLSLLRLIYQSSYNEIVPSRTFRKVAQKLLDKSNTMKFIHSALLLSLVTALLPAQVTAEQTSDNTAEIVFSDDFNTGSLDRDKWNVIGPTFWVNNEQQAYIDSEETINFLPAGAIEGAEDGVLVLRPKFEPGFETPTGRVADFVSGRINTRDKFDFTHGRAAARIKMPDAVGVWPAFWLLGNGDWPYTGEIDIMEYVGEKDWIGVAAHGPGYSGETPIVNKYYFSPETDATDWHEYAVEWTAQEMLLKLDGRLIYRATRPMIEHYGEWRFDTPKFLILNFALGGAYPFKTNGIETPYNGMPAETVEQIKAGDIEMYVDWVRVTQTVTD